MPNLEYIRERGIEDFIEQQGRRIAALETMLTNFYDGRSKSYYCIAATVLSMSDLEISIDKAEKEVEISNTPDDTKTRAKILRGILNCYAEKAGIELKLRKGS